METEYYSDDEFQEPPPPPRTFKSVLKQAGVAVTGAAKYVADQTENAGDYLRRKISKMDKWAESSRIGRHFDFKRRRAKLSTELRAGLITFLMVAYILAVNPQILGITGGSCDPVELCDPEDYRIRGKDCLFVSTNTAAAECLSTLRLSLTTATAASSLIACFIMGFFANLPLALAPGMGINIYVAYQVVAQDLLTYQQAMVAIFLEGWIFIILSMTGIRGGIIRLMPKNIAFASSVGIGLLLAFSGLRNLEVIVFDSNTLVTIGGCPANNRQFVLITNYPLDISSLNSTLNSTADVVSESNAAVYSCDGGEMRSATMWLGFAGGLLMAGLTAAHVRGSLFIGIAFITIISWIPGLATSYLGAGSPIPGGEVRLDLFQKVVAAPSLQGTGLAWDWSGLGDGHFWVALFTFLYIDLLDCTGTLLSMATLLDDCMAHDAQEDGKIEIYEAFLKESKEFEGQQWAFLSDGLGIVAGSMMGITPVTVYIESAAGIEDGGRTGVTAIAVAFFFFIALFFSPILASIPPYATGPALILVGVLLIAHVDRIVWDDTLESIPAFLTVIVMPFTLSVAYGVIAGIVSYLALHVPIWWWQWMKTKIAEYKKRRRRRQRRKAREVEASANGGGGVNGGGGGNGGIPGIPRPDSGGGGGDDFEDSEEDDSGNAPQSISSSRSRRRVHRKMFGIEDSRDNLYIQGSERGGGSVYGGDPSSMEMIDPGAWGINTNAVRHGQVSGALRRSTSHGSFHAAAMVGSGVAVPVGVATHSVSGHRGMPRSMSHAANYGGAGGGSASGYSSRNGSWGQEGILANSLGGGFGGAGGGLSPMRGPSSNNPSGRGLSRAISMGANLGRTSGTAGIGITGGGGGGGGGGPGYLNRVSGGGNRFMSRSKTFTDMGSGSVPSYGLGGGGFLGGGGLGGGGGGGPAGRSISPSRSPMGYRIPSAGGIDDGAGASGGGGVGSGGGDGSSGGLFGAVSDDSSLLFGGKLLSLDLENDAADVLASPSGAGGGEADKTTTTTEPIRMPATTTNTSNTEIEAQDSLALSSPDRGDLGQQRPSVDLNAFKTGLLSSSSFGRKNSSGDGAAGGGKSDNSNSTYLTGLPAEPGITIHKSISGKGSISFDRAAHEALVAHTETLETLETEKKEGEKTAADAADGHSTIRVEGWPSSSNTSPQQQPQLLAGSLPKEGSIHGQSSHGSGRELKRIESAAAIRLRNLFQSDDDPSNSGSDAGGGAGGSVASGSRQISSSPPSFNDRPGSSSSNVNHPRPLVSGTTAAPAPIRAPHQSYSATPASPFDQMASPPENQGGVGDLVMSPHHVLSPRAAAAAANINLPTTIMSGQVWDSDIARNKEESDKK